MLFTAPWLEFFTTVNNSPLPSSSTPEQSYGNKWIMSPMLCWIRIECQRKDVGIVYDPCKNDKDTGKMNLGLKLLRDW
jgi:hypothetical protein